MKAPLPDGYDVALLFNVIHGLPPENNAALLRKVNGALSSGGIVVIMDQLVGKPSGRFAKAYARLQGLNLLNEVGGQTYAFEEITRWFAATGFAKARRINLLKAPGLSLVLGTKGV